MPALNKPLIAFMLKEHNAVLPVEIATKYGYSTSSNSTLLKKLLKLGVKHYRVGTSTFFDIEDVAAKLPVAMADRNGPRPGAVRLKHTHNTVGAAIAAIEERLARMEETLESNGKCLTALCDMWLSPTRTVREALEPRQSTLPLENHHG